MRINPYLALLCTGVVAFAQSAFAVDPRLPDIGSSAGAVASPEEQRQYGFYMLHELRNQGAVLEDELLNDYMNTLGYRLVSYSPKPDQPFTFFLLRNTEINASAMPGGFVEVNAGLLTMTEHETELAAVLAHEISHITQNHLIRAVEAEEKMTPLMVLAMIGALAASSHQNPYSTSNADVGAMATVQGLAAQMQINFTRSDEIEADRIGIQTLAKAGFDPEAMADTFERMQRAIRPTFDENDIPALLQDHPVTTERISEARARATVIKKEESAHGTSLGASAASQTAVNSIFLPPITPGPGAMLTQAARPAETSQAQRARAERYYALMRERVRVLAAEHPAESVGYYQDNLRTTVGFDTPANHYGLVLALVRAGRAKEALEPMRKLVEASPDNLAFQLAMGDAELYSGARDAALRRYAHIAPNFPNNRALALAHADALMRDNDRAAAKQAQDVLRPLVAKDDEDPQLYTAFGRACDLAGDSVRAGEAYATAAYLNGHAEDALNQLQQLTKRVDLNYYQRTRVEALIEQMTPLVLELRRRKIKPEDQGKFAPGFSLCVSSGCDAASSDRNNTRLK